MKTTKPFGLRLFALLAVSALIVAACTRDTTEGGGEASTTTAGEGVTDTSEGGETAPPAEGGTFRVGVIGDITTDNWWASLETESRAQNQVYLANMKTSLFTTSLPGFVYVPAAAATDIPVKAVQEGGIWVVEQPIRTDMEWSDGVPVTANDLVFYFETVREFNLGKDHAASFPPAVLRVTAPSDHLVRIEFDGEPRLPAWQYGIGLASFVPSHFWEPSVEEARAASAEVTATTTDQDAIDAIVAASLEDADPTDDIAPEDVTQADIETFVNDAAASEGRTVLYAVTAPKEPSAGSQIYDRWEKGAFAATVSNATYYDRGTENTLYSDGSFRIANQTRGEDVVYGGAGAGDKVAHYIEGPFVSEILWIEYGTKEVAYESLAAGEIDFVHDPTGITSGLRNELANRTDLQFSINQTERFRYLAFNMRKAPMSDVAFRKAVATVINKELVANSVLAGAITPGYTIVHPDLIFWHNPDVNRPGWFDGVPGTDAQRFTEAVRILKDAGYTWDVEPVIDPGNLDAVTTPGVGLTMPDGTRVPELTILAPGPGYDPFRATFSIWIEQWLNDLGIPAETDSTDFDAILDAVFPPQTPESTQGWDMYMLGWGGGDIPLPGILQVALFHSREDAVDGGGFNTPGYRSNRFDAAADAFEAATDVATAAELTMEMDQILSEELPYVVLFRTPIIEVYQGGVQFPTQVIMGGHSGFPNAWPSAVQVSE